MVAGVAIGGCDCNPARDGGGDAGYDAGYDAGNTPVDAGYDAGNTPVDAGYDAGNTPVDAGYDAGVDAGPNPITCGFYALKTCANAADRTITIAPGESKLVSGTVDARGDDHFLVTFSSADGVTTAFRPRIQLVTNPGNVYTFEVLRSCDETLAGCTGTDFQMVYPGAPGGCAIANKCQDDVARPLTMVVRVKRTGVPTNCFQYGLEVSNLP